MLASILLVILGLCCCTKQSSQFQLDWPEFSVPSDALVMDIVDLLCGISYPVDDERIHLQIFKQGDREVILGEYTLSAGESFASIPRQIKAEDEGYLECVASVQNNTEINATVSAAHFIRVVEPVQDARIINTGPNELFAGNNLELQCEAELGNHLSYKWFLDGSLIAPSSFQQVVDNWLKIPRVSSKDSGSYTCVAENAFNATLVFSSNSSEVVITVKEQASSTFPPDLMYVSFTVVKEDVRRYAAIVTCQTAGGDLPVTFSLYKDNELISNESFPERRAAFKVPVVLDQQSGELRCQANSGDQTRSSHTIPFEIASVAGPVTVVSDYDMAKNYAVIFLRLHCSPAKGTHPRFQWYLNQTPLHGQGSFYRVDHQPPKLSTLLLSVGSSSSGEYRCEVWDSFDNSTAISSKRLYVDKEALNRLPTAVVAVVFGCFAFLILLVSFCCLSGVVYRWKRRQQKREPSFEMDRELVVPEDEMDFTVYSEDDDVPRAPSDELYQESEASEDEWPQIEQEKSTLEN